MEEAFAAIKLVAKAVDAPEQQVLVSSLGLRRVKAPYIPFPAAWRDGLLVTSAVASTPAYYTFEQPAPIVFARPQTTHAGSVTLKRIQETFKDAVSVLPLQQLAAWSLSAKSDKDTYTFTWTHTGELTEPTQLPVLAYSEFNGRGQLRTLPIAVQWIDPLKLDVTPLNAALAGSSQRFQVRLDWSEQAVPQPVTLAWQNLPAGFSGAPTEIAADQRIATVELNIAADVVTTGATLQLQATSQFGGHPFSVPSAPVPIQLLAPPTKLDVFPSSFALNGVQDQRQLIVRPFDGPGMARDWTRGMRFLRVIRRLYGSDSGKAFAVADGTADILVEVGTIRQTIPVTVAHTMEPL